MKRTTEIIVFVALLALLYPVAVRIYLANCPEIIPEAVKRNPEPSPEEIVNSYKDVSESTTLDTLAMEAKSVLVIETTGFSSELPDGYIEVGSPLSENMNHRLVLSRKFAKKLETVTRGDTLFLSVNLEKEGCDMKYYATDLKALICRSNHLVTLVGLKADRFYIQAQQDPVGVYDRCKIGVLSTHSNRFTFVNGSVIDELKSDNTIYYAEKSQAQ